MSRKPEDADSSSKWSSSEPWSSVKHTPGAYPPSPNLQVEQHMADHSSIAAAVKARRLEYIRKQSIKIKVGSWNVASVSGAEKDLAGWFVKGYGVEGLSNDLSRVSMDSDDSDFSSSSDGQIESVEEQELRFKKKKSSLPKRDKAAVASEDDVGLYALGLQEVIDITSVTEAIRPYYDPNPGKKWKHALKKALPAGYVKVAEIQLLGLLILIYAAPHVAPFISSIDCVSVGTGALGYMGNKGATSVRIVLGGTTRILFVNSHLAAGADKTALDRRIWDTSQILSRTRFAPANYDGDILEGAQEQIGDEDFAFWFGDLNYRLDGIPGEDVRRLLLLHTRNEYDVMNKSKRKIDSELGYINVPESDTNQPSQTDPEHYEYGAAERPALESSAEPPLDPKDDPASLYTTLQALLAHDQLRTQQKLGKAFHEGWREGDINFLPTYKYDIGSVGMFDSGEKKRSPSWCDRILFRTRRDKQAYDERVKREQAARKRDDELKSRGVEVDAADQEVLFDYDPDTDGTGEYDEYDEGEDVPDDVQSVKTVEGAEDTIKLDDYVSHQRVLSSDHKPLSAVFTLTYDAVIPDLKNKVHAEVTRDFDKNENESRPSITVVVENLPGSPAHADRPTGTTELNDMIFATVRYDVPQTRTLTIANTSPIATIFAFVDRPSSSEGEHGAAPSWLSIHVNQESYSLPAKTQELGAATAFILEPGDVTTVDLTLHVSQLDLVRQLNQHDIELDDILVLRVLYGRDHFIRVKGLWMATCFGRSLEELVLFVSRLPEEKRAESGGIKAVDDPVSPSSNSTPRPLFSLCDALPGLVERAVADWAMIHVGEDAPWVLDLSWPFLESGNQAAVYEAHSKELAHVREAIDTEAGFENCFDPVLSPFQRAELLATVLTSFLASIQDGIIPTSAWTVIESKFAESEKQKMNMSAEDIQEMVIDVLSLTPINSVSFTFLTFVLTRIITELSNEPYDQGKSPPIPQSPFRQRSPTQASEISTISSIDSTSSSSTATTSNPTPIESPRSKLAFLTSFNPRRRSGLPSSSSAAVNATVPGSNIESGNSTATPTPTATPTTPQTPLDRRAKLVEAYNTRLAPVLIRASQDETAKGKEKKILETRKKRVLAVFLNNAV